MSSITQSGEYYFGKATERAMVVMLTSKPGLVLIPTGDLSNNTSGTGAPMGVHGAGRFVLPDALVTQSRTGKQAWIESKAKHEPGWLKWAGRWEHGIDKSSFDEYLEAQAHTGIDIVILVCEMSSPQSVRDPDSLKPNRDGGLWLCAYLSELKVKGRAEKHWPNRGGVGSRRGEGGWLWPRDCMYGVDVFLEREGLSRTKEAS